MLRKKSTSNTFIWRIIPASDAALRRRRLRSANLNRLTVSRCRLSTYGCRAFYYAGPAVWNSLPDELRNSDSFDSFKRFLKTILLAATSVTSALEVSFNEMRYINLCFTYFYLLTYAVSHEQMRCANGDVKAAWLPEKSISKHARYNNNSDTSNSGRCPLLSS